MFRSIFAAVLTLSTVPFYVYGNVQSKTIDIPEAGVVRYHFDDSDKIQCCDALLLIGVGTAMDVHSYDDMSAKIIIEGSHSVAVAILDHHPDHMDKRDPSRFARLANHAVERMAEVVYVGRCNTRPRLLMIGGHSASGEAAIRALNIEASIVDDESGGYNFTVGAVIGLDPYEVTEEDVIDVPSIMFGFTEATCGVSINKAAKRGYEQSNRAHRVLYQIDNRGTSLRGSIHEISTKSRGAAHCSFADHGCEYMRGGESEAVHDLVGEATSAFIENIIVGGSGDDWCHQFPSPLTVSVVCNDQQAQVSSTIESV